MRSRSSQRAECTEAHAQREHDDGDAADDEADDDHRALPQRGRLVHLGREPLQLTVGFRREQAGVAHHAVGLGQRLVGAARGAGDVVSRTERHGGVAGLTGEGNEALGTQTTQRLSVCWLGHERRWSARAAPPSCGGAG